MEEEEKEIETIEVPEWVFRYYIDLFIMFGGVIGLWLILRDSINTLLTLLAVVLFYPVIRVKLMKSAKKV